MRGPIPKFFRSGHANVDEVRTQYPLPETADELCAVAQTVGAQESAVHLGERNTEKVIKALSADGTLEQARVLHFATHGLLAGETAMLAEARAEPSLILTPPVQASEEDDGLLTASEIAQLKLDADWVVLSACNTAAAGGDKLAPKRYRAWHKASSMPGLARSWFRIGRSTRKRLSS